jgi:intracellular multiplication protein IcmC
LINANKLAIKKITFIILGIFFSPNVFAEVVTAGQVLQNLQRTVPPIITLILMISFILGIIFIHKGLSLLKKFGLPPGHMMQQGELLQPIKYIFVGTLLIYLPTSEVALTNTLLGGENRSAIGRMMDLENLNTISERIYGTSSPGRLSDYWRNVTNTLILYIQVLGLISFIRGWILLAKPSQGGQGTVGKGITHVVAGIIAINFVDVIRILRNTVLGTG